ncbi:MAG: hypothetical protein AB7S99_22840, partial [Pseudodonghicola sp.]
MVTVLNATFDGIHDVKRLDGQSDLAWSDGFIGYYSIYHGVKNDLLRANVTLTGEDWTVKTMRFGAETRNLTVLKDADGGDGRRIDFLELGYNSDV